MSVSDVPRHAVIQTNALDCGNLLNLFEHAFGIGIARHHVVMSQDRASHEPSELGWGPYVIGSALAATTAAAVVHFWFGFTPLWLAAIVGGAFGLAGALGMDNIVEALIFSLVVGFLLLFLFRSVAELGLLQFVVPAALGLSTGGLVSGVWREATSS